jgi:hypothetical protein
MNDASKLIDISRQLSIHMIHTEMENRRLGDSLILKNTASLL